MKKVLIGVPAFTGACPEALEGFMLLAYHLGRREPDYEFYLRVVGGKEQFRARNMLVNLAIQSNVDYLWMLDGDNVAPNDAFSKLVRHNKDLIGGLYLQRKAPHKSVILKQDKGDPNGYLWADDHKEGLIEVDVLGGGCMLMTKELMRQIKEPYFVPEIQGGTDVQICRKARELGYKVYCDTTVEIGHVCEPVVVYPRMVPKETRRAGVVTDEMTDSLSRFQIVGDNLVNDIRKFFGLTPQDYEATLVSAYHEHNRMWYTKTRSRTEDIEDFYRESARENMIRLSYYCVNSHWAMNAFPIFMGAHWLKDLGVKTIMDYGCGLSILAMPLIDQGFKICSVDLSGTLQLKFLEWRRNKYKISPNTWQIAGHNQMPRQRYDAIMMWDVIEHLDQPWSTLDDVVLPHLDTPGVFMTNAHLIEFKTGKEHPQHLMHFNQHDFVNDLCARYNMQQHTVNQFIFRR